MYPNQPPTDNNASYQPPQAPQQPPVPPPTDIDYLNQIAPPAPPSGFDKKTKLIMIVLGIVGALGLVFIVMASLSQSGQTNANPTNFIARLEKLEAVGNANTNRLKSNPIRNINSSMVAVVASAKSAMVNPAAALKINIKNVQREYAKTDSPAKLNQRLDDAYLNNQLDATYAREMTFELKSTIIMMQQLEKSSSLKSFKDLLQKYSKDFARLQSQYADYKDTPNVINKPATLPLRAAPTPDYSSGELNP